MCINVYMASKVCSKVLPSNSQEPQMLFTTTSPGVNMRVSISSRFLLRTALAIEFIALSPLCREANKKEFPNAALSCLSSPQITPQMG